MKKKQSWRTIQTRKDKLFFRGIILLLPVILFVPFAIVQFISFFLLFILVVSKFYSEYLVRNLHVSRIDSELRVFRHEWVKVEIKVENFGLLPAFMMVTSDLPGDIQVFNMQKTFCTLFRMSRTFICWDGLCSERGVFSVGPAVIRCADPLGLFPFQLIAEETTRLYVYPVVRSVNLKTRGGIPLGNMLSANLLFEDITRYKSLRPYNHGDEKRRINWKASAHVSYNVYSQSPGGNRNVSGGPGSLLVNEYEATASCPVMIFLNMNQHEYPRKNRKVIMERTIEAAAALCLMASRTRQDLGIIIYTSNAEGGITVIPPSSFTLVPILERLAAIDWTKNVPMDDVSFNSVIIMLNQGKRLTYGTRYIYTGSDLGDEAYIKLDSLKKRNLFPEYLIIDERTMPLTVPGNTPRYQIKESGYEII
jgi:uncharacterized protein (DUF58 family)